MGGDKLIRIHLLVITDDLAPKLRPLLPWHCSVTNRYLGISQRMHKCCHLLGNYVLVQMT